MTTKHQIGINASKFLILFDEKVDNLDLTYRYAATSRLNARIASSLDVTSANDGVTDVAIRLGLDKYFLQSGHFNFYYGIDLNYNINKIKSSGRKNQRYGLFTFIGILYQIGNHFSLSTEPTLAIQRNLVDAPGNFNPSADEDFTKVNLLNIGQVKVSFHF